MAKVHERAAALVLAVFFLVASIGGSGLIIWQIVKDNKDKKTANTAQNNANESKENKLEGTKLANFTPIASATELQKIDTKEGTGEEVKPGATVTAHYTGAIASTGTIFQSSHDQPDDQPIEFGLSGVIKGWTDGVPGMKVGGTRRLIIPAAQAYGEQSPSPNIPPNSDLVFDIELAAVKNP